MSDPITRLNAALEGRYRIERELGEGGMATVYLADDLKHERKVALKVLKPELAAVVGADRFLAEIKTTANLQHPHILPLFDSGEADSFLFYVMPFVQGETLRDRIDREKQLPVDEALGIATAVAGALQTAHDRGVVHRDIKPANILLSQGQPLVADFGIALAVSAGGSGRLTETGLSLGTPYYMSPEQATGDQAIGPASDTFALACVLYEMLIGEPPYPGNTAQAVLGKIIQGIPVSATSARHTVPANVDAAIRKALEKLPADRFTGVQGFARAIADPGFRHGALTPGDVTVDPGPWKRIAAAFAVLFVAAAAFAASAFLGGGKEPVRRVERFAAPFLEGQEHVGFGGYGGSDLSPDGSMLVYRHDPGTGQILMVRRWDDLAATPVRESFGGGAPAVSPDGLELAFQADDEIRVLAFSGGPVRTLLRGDDPEWGPESYVYATTDSGAVRVPSTGGAVEILSRLGEGEAEHVVRDVLPDGTLALVEVELVGGREEIHALDLGSGAMTLLVHGELPRYLPTGHLVYMVEGTMMAVRFDPDDGVIVGTPIAIMDGLSYFSIADDGKLYQVMGAADGAAGPTWQLSWVTRTGQTTPVDADWTFARGTDQEAGWRLSPDGSMVALRQFTSSGYDIWVKRLETGPLSRLTFSDAHEKMPVWRPGQETVTFLSDRNGNFDVWSKAADGTGEAELIVDLAENLRTFRWSPDGEWLLLETEAGDILASRVGDDEEPVPLLATRFQERYPVVSPDGRWIAYSSDETGRLEVYVAPFPDVSSGRWQVSINSGARPEWERDGGGIVFDLAGVSTALMVAEVETDRGFVTGTPTVLIDAVGWGGGPRTERVYDLGVNDDRLLVAVSPGAGPAGEPTGPRTILVNNFFEVVKRLVPN